MKASRTMVSKDEFLGRSGKQDRRENRQPGAKPPRCANALTLPCLVAQVHPTADQADDAFW
jgi:hypothetical protein